MASLPLLVVAASLVAFAASIIYNLYFHPLAKFPGPRLAAATHWYEAYYELVHQGGAQFAPKVRQLHAQYGPIVRINPDEISVNDAEFHDKLYAPQPAIRDRHPNFSSTLGTANGSFSSVDHFVHKRRRVAYSPFFSTANVMGTESMIRDKVNHCCDLLWATRESGPNLRAHFAAIGFDSFYTWAFGHSLDLLDDLPLARKCSDTVELLVTSAPFYRIFPSIMACARKVPHSVLRLLSHHVGRVFDLHTLIFQAAERFEKSQEELESGEKGAKLEQQETETLFSVIRRSKAPESEKTASRISQEGTEMFMASFTPGRTMMLGMYYLHAYPHVLQALRDELDEANPDPRVDLSYKTLNNLPYLKAVMKEIYRVTFPVGSRLPMTCHDVMEFGDWQIPAHSSISVNHRNLLFNPDVYPDPFEFRPERWLDTANPIDEKRHFVAFGKGGRGCPGRDFATQIIQFTLCTLVRRFTFELGKTDWAKDVAANRESILIAPAFASKGVQLKITGKRA